VILRVAAVLKESRQIDDRCKGDLAHLRQSPGQFETLNAFESFTASKCVEEHSHAINIRQTMNFLSDDWLVSLAYIAEVAMGVVLVTWLKKTLEFRRRFIRVQPSLRSSFDQDIPGPEAWVIAQMVPALKELGFEVAANGHCPDIDYYFAWTQILFLNRAIGDRASLVVKRAGAKAIAMIAFATEAPGESQVTTALHYRLTGVAAPKPGTQPPDVKALYLKHRQAVTERALSSDQRVLPDIGCEHQWLHGRAAKVAKNAAEKQRMVQIGEFYRLSWRSSAWHALK
jgi:hypothetical protein